MKSSKFNRQPGSTIENRHVILLKLASWILLSSAKPTAITAEPSYDWKLLRCVTLELSVISKLTIELLTVSKKHVETPLLIQMSWIVIFGGQNLMVDSMLRSIIDYLFFHVYALKLHLVRNSFLSLKTWIFGEFSWGVKFDTFADWDRVHREEQLCLHSYTRDSAAEFT